MKVGIALAIVAGALTIALVPSMPYGYYPVMRWVVCAACAWIALQSYQKQLAGWAWCWLVLAGIYNPVMPVHASRAVWSAVNIATLAVAGWYALVAYRKTKGERHE